MDIEEFIDKYGNYDGGVPLSIVKNSIIHFGESELNEYVLKMFPLLSNFKLERVVKIKKGSVNCNRYNGIQTAI
jgi:hypothetical protein